MNKVKEFLNTTTEMTHKDRIIAIGCVAVLWGVGQVMTNKWYKAECKSNSLEFEVELCREENKILRSKIDKLEESLEEVEEA